MPEALPPSAVKLIVRSLRRLVGGGPGSSQPAGPSGLPDSGTNADNYTGTFEGYNLTDPGFNFNGVVGTGSGPVIGQNRPSQ